MWRQVGIFTLTDKWQHSRPIDGILFRVRHLNVTATQGMIAQCVSDQGALHLFEKQRLLSSDLPDLFEFVSPIEPGKRMIAVRSDAFSTPWRVAVDVYEVGKVAPDYLALHSAHLASVNPHPQYLTGDAFYSALYNKVSTTELSNALENRATVAELAAAIADKVNQLQLTAAISNKATTAELAAAIADKVTSQQMAAVLATKQSTITLTAQTIDATTTDMNTPQRILIPANTSAGYEIQLIGQSMGSVPEFVYWLGSGGFYRRATAASTVLQNSTTTRRSSAGNGSSWLISTSADTINGGLRLQVRGESGKTIKWVASVKITEVS